MAPPAPWPQWQRGGPRGHSNPTFATFATLGVATTGTPFSNLKSGQTIHIAASCCITPHQRGQIGPMWGVFAPVGTKYPTYCSRCAHLAGSNQSGSWQGAHAKCEDGRTQFSQPTRWAIIFIALGAPGWVMVTKYPFSPHRGPESTMVRPTGGWPRQHWAVEPAAPGPPKVGPGSSGLGQTNQATRPGRARGRHHLEW